MLESASLLLLPWTLEAGIPETGACTRGVLDGTTAAPLGLVRSAGLSRSWLTWLWPYRLEVFETEDAALLLTLTRTWGLLRMWDLYDADGNRVGSIYPPVLLDAEGLRRGYLHLREQRGEFLGLAAQRLADFEIDATAALHLHFAADLEPNPFLRMLLLGAALTLQPPPT